MTCGPARASSLRKPGSRRRNDSDCAKQRSPKKQWSRKHSQHMPQRITIRKPDDWHLHVRDGAHAQGRDAPTTARHFGRAILMPNLIPAGDHHPRSKSLTRRAGLRGAAEGLDLRAADDLLSHRR